MFMLVHRYYMSQSDVDVDFMGALDDEPLAEKQSNDKVWLINEPDACKDVSFF